MNVFDVMDTRQKYLLKIKLFAVKITVNEF